MIDWNAVGPKPDTRHRRDPVITKALIEGALMRRDLSAREIAEFCRQNGMSITAEAAYPFVNVARETFDCLMTIGTVSCHGKTYTLTEVQRHGLIKKPFEEAAE